MSTETPYWAFRSIVLTQDQLDEAPITLLPPAGTDLISYVASHIAGHGDAEGLELQMGLRWDSLDEVWRATAYFANTGGSGEVLPTLSTGVPPAVIFEPADQVRPAPPSLPLPAREVITSLLQRAVFFVRDVNAAAQENPEFIPHESSVLRDQALSLRDLSQKFTRSLNDQIEGGPSGPGVAERLSTRRSWLPPTLPRSGGSGLEL